MFWKRQRCKYAIKYVEDDNGGDGKEDISGPPEWRQMPIRRMTKGKFER
jgi:hypothetical protein